MPYRIRSYPARVCRATSFNACRLYSTPPTASKPQQKISDDRQLILDVLSTLPSQREARHFLKRFNQVPQEKQRNAEIHYRDLIPTLATSAQRADEILDTQRQQHLGLIKLQAQLPEEHLMKFSRTLVQLQKLALTPVVVVEAPPLDSADAHHSFQEMQNRVLEELFRVVNCIEAVGGRAMPLYSGVYETSTDDTISTQLQPVHIALGLRQIPVLATLSYDRAKLTHSILNSRDALVAMSKALTSDPVLRSPVKTILINQFGGVAVNGKPIGFVNLEDEYEDVRAAISSSNPEQNDYLGHDAVKRTVGNQHLQDLEAARAILSVLPSSASAIIASATSSASLISNLITDKPLTLGSIDPVSLGELTSPYNAVIPCTPTVLRQGLRVEVHTSLDTVNLPRLVALLEASFQKPLEAQKFWDRMNDVLDAVIIAGDFDGAAIVSNEPDPYDSGGEPIPYLDKFSVAPTSQGIGVADILWKQLKSRYKDLSWRSRAANPVNKWYFERSDGNLKLPGGYWVLFWYGTQGLQRLESYKEMAGNIPASFLSPMR